MHKNYMAIATSVVLSFFILMTGIQLSSHNLYFVSPTQAAQIESSLEDNFGTPARTISHAKLTSNDRKQIECLAKNIYYEAAFEPHAGWLGVAAVTMNRVLSGNYADSVCGVVYQKTGSTYQFSWVGMKNRLSKIDEEVYNSILRVATTIYLTYDTSKDVTKGATFYHADYVNPRWNLEKTKKIGRHIFYRSPKDKIGESM